MKRSNTKTDTLQIRIDSKIIQHIYDSVVNNSDDPSEATKSDYVRSLIMHDYLLQKRSAYHSINTNMILFVSKLGDFIFLKSENLHFNKSVKTLPFRIEMKREKFKYYINKSLLAKEQWIINQFSLSRLENGSKKLIKKMSDPEGINIKQEIMDLDKLIVKGSNLIRETFVIMNDYVQYFEDCKENEENYDSLRCFVDIPTKVMDILVIIDNDLYKKTNIYGDGFVPELYFDLRSGEDIIMDYNFNDIDPPLQPFKISNNFPRRGNTKGDEKYNETLSKIKKSIILLNENILENKNAYSIIDVPEKYSFYNLIVPNVPIGLTWSINWPKPQKY